MEYSEFLRWLSYRRKRGGFNTALRAEQGFALLASMYANSHSKGGGYKIYDFMPHMEEPSISLEDAMSSWT